MRNIFDRIVDFFTALNCVFTLLFSTEERRQLDYDNGCGEID